MNLRRDGAKIRHKLSALTDILLAQESSSDELVKTGHEIFDTLAPLANMEDRSIDPSINGDTLLECGMALSPRNAGRCAREAVRTAIFLRGIEKAVKDLKERFPDRQINILYAGCGPFALLALPLMIRPSGAGLSFTLIDIHRRSLDSARKIIEGLGLNNFVRDYVEDDAARYRYSGEEPLHMVITETMQESLQKETQAAITLNLAPQICEGGILIPEKITVQACLANTRKERPIYKSGANILNNKAPSFQVSTERLNLGRLIDFTAERAIILGSHTLKDERGRNHFPPVEITIPENADPSLDRVMLFTGVDVYGDFSLGDYESTITNPVKLDNLGRPQNGSTIEFKYIMGKNPGYEWKLKEAP